MGSKAPLQHGATSARLRCSAGPGPGLERAERAPAGEVPGVEESPLCGRAVQSQTKVALPCLSFLGGKRRSLQSPRLHETSPLPMGPLDSAAFGCLPRSCAAFASSAHSGELLSSPTWRTSSASSHRAARCPPGSARALPGGCRPTTCFAGRLFVRFKHIIKQNAALNNSTGQFSRWSLVPPAGVV